MLLAGCVTDNADLVVSDDSGVPTVVGSDLGAPVFESPDMTTVVTGACGDTDPSCACPAVVPPFSLAGDPMHDPNASDSTFAATSTAAW